MSRGKSAGGSVSRLVVVLAGFGVCLAAFVLYVMTLAPGVLYYDRPLLMDSAMLQVHAYILGISHPTGYPTYLMITHLLTYLPFGDVAYRVNLASAVYAAVAVLLVYVAGWLLTRRVVAAAAGALAVAAGPTFWSMAIVAEVYTLNALMILAQIIALLLWRGSGRDRYLLLAAFLMGLALTNHLTSGLVIPAGLLFVALVDRRKLADWRLILEGAGLFLLGLVPYIYLPIRASAPLPMKENDPTTPARFLELVTGSQLNGSYLGLNLEALPGRVEFYGVYLLSEFGPLLLVVAVLGAVIAARGDRPLAALTIFLYLGWLVHALSYDIYDVQLYFIPTYLMVGIWIALGAGFLQSKIEGTSSSARRGDAVLAALFAGLLLISPIVTVATNYSRVDRSGDQEGRRIIQTVSQNVEPGATVLHNRSSLWYMVVVEHRRTDLKLLDPFRPPAITTYDLAWPGGLSALDPAARSAMLDTSGVQSAREAAKDGPVYLLDQESANIEDFRRAGFKVKTVKKGILYQLIPQQR